MWPPPYPVCVIIGYDNVWLRLDSHYIAMCSRLYDGTQSSLQLHTVFCRVPYVGDILQCSIIWHITVILPCVWGLIFSPWFSMRSTNNKLTLKKFGSAGLWDFCKRFGSDWICLNRPKICSYARGITEERASLILGAMVAIDCGI